MPVAISADHLSKRFYLHRNQAWSVKERFLGVFHPERREVLEEFWALRDVSLDIERGESVGVIGSNGSGKSTFLKLVAGIHRPTLGHVRLTAGSHVGSMIELGLGFHAELTGRENVLLSASVHGLSRSRILEILQPVVEYSGLVKFIDEPLKNYSSGMMMRLGFAIAVHLEPEILLLDEIFAVGDADFQQRCIRTIRQLRERKKTIVFVSHAESAVKSVCSRACLLDHGVLKYEGSVSGAFAAYARLRTGAAPFPAGAADAQEAGRSLAPDALNLEWLQTSGLQPTDRVLELGCRDLEKSLPLVKFLSPGRYVGVDADPSAIIRAREQVLPADGIDPDRVQLVATNRFVPEDLPPFDVVIARDALQRLPLNAIARCLVSVVRQLAPEGRFVANFWEQPGDDFAPLTRPGGLTTSLDAAPYQYSLDMLKSVAAVVGADAERADGDPELGTAAVIVFRPQPGRLRA